LIPFLKRKRIFGGNSLSVLINSKAFCMQQVSTIFSGVEIWFTGYTDKLSYYHLRQLVLANGGKVT
jgi:hypothetical protein